jgi:hypothetical protein
MAESLEKIKKWDAELDEKKVELEQLTEKEEKEEKSKEIEKIRNQKSALQSRVNRKLESLNLQGNIGKLKDLLNWIIFDVFEPEINSDAARERIHNMLMAGPDGETPAAMNTPKTTRGRGVGQKSKAKKVTTEVLKKDVAALVDKVKK